MFNNIFNSISVISWWSGLLVDETVIFIHLFDSGILLIIDLNREKGGG